MTIALQKRRHPDGFILWDVYIGGAHMGLVRQQAVAAPSWFAYNLRSNDPIGRYATRREAIAAITDPNR